MKHAFTTIAILAALGAMPVAHGRNHSDPAAPAATARSAEAALSEGEVRKVDKETKKLTIRHGPIANLDMPPMTMVFRVQDPALLDSVKAGDKVRFNAEKSGGAYVVTQIEAAK